MGYFRSTLAYQGGGETDYSATYTVTIDGVKQKGYCGYLYDSVGSSYTSNGIINIGNNVINCVYMFNNTNDFSNDIIIPSSVNNLYRMFANSNFSKNIYVKGTVSRIIESKYMFYGANNSKRKNIYFNTALNGRFNYTSSSSSMVGASITWTTMTNGFYNATYNIYCYNNYEG